ncbi:UNVERIFIED_CONTAM: hypothetical protein PYX00_009532 [Menopon gallinae]|uniref:Uncharacterized protein n=1 Tax=Menopon gallinae TaxID=328185 RepID=A0AAW2HCB0_9NEOP
MASWISSIVVVCILVTVCVGIEFGEFQHFPEAALGGEEIIEHHTPELLHHEHKPATSYQNFNLESKDPVPVIVKKELHHHEEEGIGFEGGLEHHHIEEPIDFKGF